MVMQDDPQISMTQLPWEPKSLDLSKLGFYFAVQRIERRIGDVKVQLVNWERGEDKVKKPLELVSCDELLPNGAHASLGESIKKVFSIE